MDLSLQQGHPDLGSVLIGTFPVPGRCDSTGQYLNSSISQIVVGYHFTQQFGLQLNLPVIVRALKRPEGLEIQSGSERGLGDIPLAGTFVAFQHKELHSTFVWSVLGGVKFPTGDTDRWAEELHGEEHEVPGAPGNGLHGHDLTLGSGSIDGVIGSSVFGRWKRALFTASMQYAIRSEGDYDYQFANDLFWSGGPGAYVMLSEEQMLVLQANISGEDKERDDFAGGKAEDTGVTTVFLGPQFNYTFGERFSAEVGAGFPVVRSNTSLQLTPDYRIRAAVNWRF